MKEWAGSIIAIRKLFASCRPDSLSGGESFSFGQDWSLSREMKAATLGLQGAVSLGRVGFQFCIDLTNTCNGLLRISTGIRSLVGITFTHGKGKKD
jgi:hypothetical protein